MAEDLVLTEHIEDDVAVLTLNNPPVNALSIELLEALGGAVEALSKNLPSAVVVTGGKKVFAAGADISQFGSAADAERVSRTFQAALDALEALPRITIAEIAGVALGGGLELAMACDLRVAAHNAKLGQPEILLGLIPGAGGTQRLPRLIGAGRALELIVTGKQISAKEAHALGLVNEVVDRMEIKDAARGLATQIATGPLAAQAAAKEAVNAGRDATLSDGLERERQLFAALFDTEDAKIGVESFLEHGPGKATFVGR